MKDKFEIDSACSILGLELDKVLRFFFGNNLTCQEIDGKYYTDAHGIGELDRYSKMNDFIDKVKNGKLR